MKSFTLSFCLFLFLIAGCTPKPNPQDLDPEANYRYLKERYEKGRYLDAVEGLDSYTLNYSGSSKIDSAQYLLAMSHLKLKEYLIAASSFEELTRRFPRSPMVPEAMFMAGVCYWNLSPRYALDQEYTAKSQDSFQSFIDYYPDRKDKVLEAQGYIAQCRDKLAHKIFASAVIYLKMKDYRAAALYFKDVTDRFYDTQWAPQAAFQYAHSLEGEKLFDEARSAYQAFATKYPDHPWQGKVDAALKKLEQRESESK